MIGSSERRTAGEVVRFLLVGALNTVLTAVLFAALTSVVAPTIAYTVAFAAGMVFAVLVTPRLVFRARAAVSQRVRYAGWYLFLYAFGLGVVYVLSDGLDMKPAAVALVTVVMTASLSFLGAKVLFVREEMVQTHDT